MALRREKITPDIDPIIPTLDCDDPEGIQRKGQYGIDYRYVVNKSAGIM